MRLALLFRQRRQVTVLVEVELAVLDAEHERLPLGLARPVGPLLVVAWIAPEAPRPKPLIAFLFDGGVLADASAIVLQESELDDYRFVAPSAVAGYLPPHMTARVESGLRARNSGGAAYVPTVPAAET